MEGKRVKAKDSIFRNYHLFTMLCALILAAALLISGRFVLAGLAAVFVLVEIGLLYLTVSGKFARK